MIDVAQSNSIQPLSTNTVQEEESCPTIPCTSLGAASESVICCSITPTKRYDYVLLMSSAFHTTLL